MIRFGILLSATIAVLSASAGAASNEALAFAIGQCSAEPDAKARLACYDGLATKLKTGIPLAAAPAGTAVPSVAQAPASPPPVAQSQPPAVPSQVASAPPPQAQRGTWYDPTSWFGKDAPQRASNNPADFGGEQVRKPATEQASDAPLEEISAHVASVSFNPYGRFTVTLDNGQVWRQIQADTGVARFRRKGGDSVTISRGMLGSYNLTLAGTVQLFKVTRVQ